MWSLSETVLHLPRRRMFSALELHAFAIGSIAAVVFFVGWGLNVDLAKTLIPGFPEMRPRTAFAFMLLSLSCILSARHFKYASLLSSLIAGGVIVWLGQLVGRFLLAAEPGADLSRLIQIQATLFSILFGGAAILIINLAPPRFAGVAGAVAVLAATPALYRILSLLLFWGAPPEDSSLLNSMALHTAVLIVWFMACVLMHPRLGFGDVIFQASLRGRVVRRVLPIVILLPVGAAAISLALSHALGWQNEVLFGLTATLSVTIGATLVWWLSRLIAEWQAEANEHSNRLSRANEALEQYASSAAHDLKAPARHVRLYGELLKTALAKGDLESANKYADRIGSAATELPVIIDGMLDFSRSGFSKVSPSDHRLSELVMAATALQEADLKAVGAKIILERDAHLWCDSQLMTTVFQNLVANSLKNRRPDRPLEIRIDAEPGSESVEISVADNGVGFDPEFAVVAFNPLARGVKLAGGGTGIGLSICRTILQGHGGEIRIDPAFRGGARIEVVLPAKA
jgi:signal transduction histidine kinase